MSFMAKYYDRMLAATEEACLRDWRRQMLASASGVTVEVGAGSGANIEHYPDEVSELILTEPDAAMRELLLAKREVLAAHHAHVEPWSMDAMPREDNSVDTVVCTLVCCSVPNMASALTEVLRVLKPGGRLIFIEHVAALDNPSRARWQNIANPLWKRIAGNCHLNRHTEQALIDAGFAFEGEVIRESMRKAMPLVRPSIRGIALKPQSA